MTKSSHYAELTCPQCGVIFKPRHSRQFRCSFECSKRAHKETQQKKRYKICAQCAGHFFDNSYKNSRHMCSKCEISGFSEIAYKLQHYITDSHLYSEAKLIQRLSEMRKNEKFYGRIGEVLFLHLYPDSIDLNIEKSETHPFDFTHKFLGRVDVKTCLPVFRHGSKSWSFQKHKDASCDFLFCIGICKDRKSVERIWLIPRKIFLSGSLVVCYDPETVVGEESLLWLAPFEITFLYNLSELNLYLQKLLKVQPKWAYDLSLLEPKIPLWKGRLGELIFYTLHPKAIDMLVAHGIDSPYDFEDQVLGRVDVKAGAPDNNGYFHLRRKEKAHREVADSYFYVGFSRSYKKIVALFCISKEIVHNIKGTLKLKPNESPYDVTHKYDISKIGVEAIKKGKWKLPKSL